MGGFWWSLFLALVIIGVWLYWAFKSAQNRQQYA